MKPKMITNEIENEVNGQINTYAFCLLPVRERYMAKRSEIV